MKRTFPGTNRRRRGSALILAILLSVVITAIVMIIACYTTTLAQACGSLSKLDQAIYSAESGAQRVAWYCRNNKMSSINSPVSGTVNGCSYTTSWVTVSGNTIRITSKSSNASVSYTMYQTCAPPSSPVAVVTSGGTFQIQNIVVTGDVTANGNFSCSGSGSITGDLTYGGLANNTSMVSGTVTHGTTAALNMANIGSTLVAAAGQTINNPNNNNLTYNFTALSGTNKVIYVNGNVTGGTFIGSGTLYVSGQASLGSFGTAANPVHIVCGGNITITQNATVYGSVYSAGTYSQGKINMTGNVYCASNFNQTDNLASSMTAASAPWFDPRGGGGNSPAIFSDFAGPNP